MKRKIFSILFALVLMLSFSLVTAVPAAAYPWYAKLRAEITSPQEGEWIAVGSTFTVAVTIYNEGTGNAEAVDVDCVLNGSWPAGEFPGQNLAFAEGETRHKNPPASEPGSDYPYIPIEPDTSMNFTWQVVCTGPGVTKIRINSSACCGPSATDTVTFYQVVPPIQVTIDIKPDSNPNSINPNSKGVIPVAILTTPDFDATTVDGTTVMFEGASPAHDLSDPAIVAEHQQDVDGDGDIDYVFHFRTQETGIAKGQTSATLIGYTYGGMGIEGTDSVRTVGK